MNDVVRLEWPTPQIGLIRVANPPVNASSHAVRQGLVAAVEAAAKQGDAKMLVLACDGRTFMAGADIREFGKPWEAPGLPEVVDACADAADWAAPLGPPKPIAAFASLPPSTDTVPSLRGELSVVAEGCA